MFEWIKRFFLPRTRSLTENRNYVVFPAHSPVIVYDFERGEPHILTERDWDDIARLAVEGGNQ